MGLTGAEASVAYPTGMFSAPFRGIRNDGWFYLREWRYSR
jgi:hypothetical protein